MCLSLLQPFRCAHCRYSCNSPGPLKRHYKMKHPDHEYHNTGPGLTNSAETLELQGPFSILVFCLAWASCVSVRLIFCNCFAHNISILNITTVCPPRSHDVYVCLCVLGAMKCPQCEFVYSTKWELNRHLKNKHCLKVVEGTWEVNSVYITEWLLLFWTKIAVKLPEPSIPCTYV